MDAENVNDRQPFNRLNFALVFRQSWPGPSQKLLERMDPAESSVTALEQLGEVCPTATVSAPEAHATTEGTLTAPSFIGISGSPPLTQSSAAPQGDRTRATTASELHVVPPPPIPPGINNGLNQAFILGPGRLSGRSVSAIRWSPRSPNS